MIRDRNEWEWNIQLRYIQMRYCCYNSRRSTSTCSFVTIEPIYCDKIKRLKELFKGCLHGAIATAIYVSEIEAWVKFNVSVHMV